MEHKLTSSSSKLGHIGDQSSFRDSQSNKRMICSIMNCRAAFMGYAEDKERAKSIPTKETEEADLSTGSTHWTCTKDSQRKEILTSLFNGL